MNIKTNKNRLLLQKQTILSCLVKTIIKCEMIIKEGEKIPKIVKTNNNNRYKHGKHQGRLLS